MISLEDSINKTLAYSDHFSFPLTESELHTRLIRVQSSQQDLHVALKSLVQAKQILYSRPYYYLPGHEHLPLLRKERASYSRSLSKLATHYAKRLGRLPGVLAVYLTGSLAVDNAAPTDDIDLMIITRRGVLWTTRLLLTIYTTLLRLRRTPAGKRTAGKLCLNLYLDPAALTLPKSRRSLYTAYELIQAVPLHDPDNTHDALLAANPWLSDFLPNQARTLLNRKPGQRPSWDTKGGRRVLMVFLATFESLAYRLQYLYMKRKITREHITRNAAFFHPHDPSKLVLEKLNLTERV